MSMSCRGRGRRARVIVTSDHDFEPAKVPAHILVSTPAHFAADTVDVDPLRAVAAVNQIAARSRNPGLSVEALLVLVRGLLRDA